MRLASQHRLSDRAKWAAVSCVAAGWRFGADISKDLAEDLAGSETGAEGAVSNPSVLAWPGATLCAEGRYLQARKHLVELLDANQRVPSSNTTALRLAQEAHANLGNIEQAERLRDVLRKRTIAYSEPLATVTTKLASADLLLARMYLDMGKPVDRVRQLLHKVLEMMANEEDTEARALKAEAEILLVLAGGKAPECEALTSRLELAMSPLMDVLPLSSDRKAAEFGSRPWTGGGLFPGTSRHAGFDNRVARYLDPARCVLIDAGAEAPARELLGRWRVLLARHAEVENPAPAVHRARALAAAAAYRLDGLTDDRAAAEAGRTADCAANGTERAELYGRAFFAARIT